MLHLMAPPSQTPKRAPKPLYVELSEDQMLDLQSFSKIHYNAPNIEIIRAALREHIAHRLEEEPLLRERFYRAREELREELRRQASDSLRLVDKPSKPPPSPADGTESSPSE
jgi:hypothetical protein